MTVPIPASHMRLLTDPIVAHLATLLSDGRPQVNPVWCDYDGKHVLFNTAEGRLKDRNLRRDPRVALSIMDPENPYRYLQIRGRVVDVTKKGADQHIDKMAKKYLNKDKYPFRQPGEERVIFKIEPEKTQTMG